MAHIVSKATLGLTYHAQIGHPKISFAAKETELVEWRGDILAVGVTEKDMSKDKTSKFQNPILKKHDSISTRVSNEPGARYINKEDDREGIVPYFELASIMAATDDFTEKNQLGQGGFRPVYKRVSEKAKANWARKKMAKVTGEKIYAKVREEDKWYCLSAEPSSVLGHNMGLLLLVLWLLVVWLVIGSIWRNCFYSRSGAWLFNVILRFSSVLY
ncbi:leucine aminopeptidase 1-like protein [Tanacetum coccineum]